MPELEEDVGPPSRSHVSGATADAMRVVHWLPGDALTWVCPTCSRTFVRDTTEEPWRQQ